MGRLRIPEPLLEKLRELRAAQLQHPHPDNVIQREEAIILTLGFGPALYLCFDGRVLIWHYMDDESIREATDLNDIAGGIVIGSKNNDLPELLDLLPKQPDNGTPCPDCSGRRWLSFGPNTSNGEPRWVVCPVCHGLAWVPQPTS